MFIVRHLIVGGKRHNAGLQLRRAISIQAEGKKLLEKHAVAPSAAGLCYAAPCNDSTLIKECPAARLQDGKQQNTPA